MSEDRWMGWARLGVVLTVWILSSSAQAEENDIALALRVAREYHLDAFQTKVLLCTRVIENGRPGREYGVLHPQALNTTQRRQAQWAAGTIKKRLPSAQNLPIFAGRWAPSTAHPLNAHWLQNMTQCLAQLGERGSSDE